MSNFFKKKKKKKKKKKRETQYGLVDLADKGIDGGYLNKKWFAGVNWWANRRIRISAGYGRATLEKARDDRPHQPVLHALAVGVLILTGVERMKNMKPLLAVGLAALVLLAALPVVGPGGTGARRRQRRRARQAGSPTRSPTSSACPSRATGTSASEANNGSEDGAQHPAGGALPGLSDDWNLITRTIVPVASQFDLTGASTSESGLGDSVVTAFLSPS